MTARCQETGCHPIWYWPVLSGILGYYMVRVDVETSTPELILLWYLSQLNGNILCQIPTIVSSTCITFHTFRGYSKAGENAPYWKNEPSIFIECWCCHHFQLVVVEFGCVIKTLLPHRSASTIIPCIQIYTRKRCRISIGSQNFTYRTNVWDDKIIECELNM